MEKKGRGCNERDDERTKEGRGGRIAGRARVRREGRKGRGRKFWRDEARCGGRGAEGGEWRRGSREKGR